MVYLCGIFICRGPLIWYFVTERDAVNDVTILSPNNLNFRGIPFTIGVTGYTLGTGTVGPKVSSSVTCVYISIFLWFQGDRLGDPHAAGDRVLHRA